MKMDKPFLTIGGQFFELDTTDFKAMNYRGLYAALEAELNLRPVNIGRNNLLN